jgi:bacterial/archaeal transporter family protein
MKAVVFAVLAGVCWGVGELFTKSVLHSRQVGPMALLLVRTAAALPPALIAYLVAAKLLGGEPQWWKAETPVMLKLVLGSALLAGFGGVFFFYLGLAHGEISVVKPIAFTVGPAVAVVLAWLVLKEEMNLAKILGVVMVLAGVVLISGFGGRAQGAAKTGGMSSADPGGPAQSAGM